MALTVHCDKPCSTQTCSNLKSCGCARFVTTLPSSAVKINQQAAPLGGDWHLRTRAEGMTIFRPWSPRRHEKLAGKAISLTAHSGQACEGNPARRRMLLMQSRRCAKNLGLWNFYGSLEKPVARFCLQPRRYRQVRRNGESEFAQTVTSGISPAIEGKGSAGSCLQTRMEFRHRLAAFNGLGSARPFRSGDPKSPESKPLPWSRRRDPARPSRESRALR